MLTPLKRRANRQANYGKLGPVYKEKQEKQLRRAKIPAQEVADAMQKDGSYMAGNYQVFQRQVDISKQKPSFADPRFIPTWRTQLRLDRLFYVALEYAYGVKDDRVVLSFPKHSADQIGIYPS
jgi:glycyl-tRNA synthetase (class II)